MKRHPYRLLFVGDDLKEMPAVTVEIDRHSFAFVASADARNEHVGRFSGLVSKGDSLIVYRLERSIKMGAAQREGVMMD